MEYFGDLRRWKILELGILGILPVKSLTKGRKTLLNPVEGLEILGIL